MNAQQIARQIKHRLDKAKWPASASKVFGSVIVSVRIPQKLLDRQRMPVIVIRPGGAQADPERGEETELIQQTFFVRLFAANEHDGEGEAAILGSNRKGDTSSQGKGLLELDGRLIKEIGSVTGIDGCRILNSFRSSADVELEAGTGAVVYRDYLFDALVGNDKFYHSPKRLVATAPGGGDASLTWRLPPDRFDFVTVELVRKTGSTAPTSPTDGTSVNKSPTDTSFVDSPGVGTFSYSAFAWYDEDKKTPADENIFSTPDTFTIVTT